jgi:hypothetical protein
VTKFIIKIEVGAVLIFSRFRKTVQSIPTPPPPPPAGGGAGGAGLMRAAREFNAKLFLPKFKIGTHRPHSASYSSKNYIFTRIYTQEEIERPS